MRMVVVTGVGSMEVEEPGGGVGLGFVGRGGTSFHGSIFMG